MAAKVFFLFVTVLILFEAEAAFYRREFFDPGSPFMRELMVDEDPISRRAMSANEDCRDENPPFFCRAWASKGYCSNPTYYTRPENFRTFTQVLCRRTCGRC